MNSISCAGRLACLAAALCTSAVFAASTARAQWQIPDGGQPRVFDLALDELDVRGPDGRAAAAKIPRAADARGLTDTARARSQAGQVAAPVFYEQGRPRDRYTRRVATTRVLVTLEEQSEPAAIAAAAGARGWMPAPALPGTILVDAATPADALDLTARLQTTPGVRAADPLLARWRAKRWIPNDTLFAQQWHLLNTGQGGGTAGMDVNVTNVWSTARGAGIRIGIVDDGLQVAHPDLAANADTALDHDWNDATPDDPSPDVTTDYHGTSCAGVAAARGNNSLGVSGAAPEATLVGLRLIAATVSDADEAAAMSYSNSVIQVKSNSWGPNDDGMTLEGPGALTQAALADACANGRGGRGTIFVWAGGNGLDYNDNANYDGYANSIYTIAVAAVTDGGAQAWYSEPGACLVVCAPSSGGATDIVTTDLTGNNGYNAAGVSGELSDVNYTKTFGGTSSATPLVAGVISLMLQTNPDLGWRDVQEILIRSATKNQPADTGWATNGAGFHFNHKFGAGLINAHAAVQMAQTWTNLAAAASASVAQTGLSVAIPDNNATGVVRTFAVATALRAEQVTVTLSVSHNNRGDLDVRLVSPAGTESVLAETHSDTGNHYSSWTFSTVRHWGESAQGAWTLRVSDRASGTTGTLTAATLTVRGTALAHQPPAITLDPEGAGKTTTTGTPLSFQVIATESDGDSVTLTGSSLPAGATLTPNPATGTAPLTSTFNWTPSAAGNYTARFIASDVDGSVTQDVSIAVSAPTGILIDEPFDGGVTPPTGWTFTAIGGTYTTTSNYGRAAPSLKFDNTGDQIVTPTFSNATNITVWLKGQGEVKPNNYMRVEQYSAGAWSTLATVQPVPLTSNTYSWTLSGSVTQLRFTYTKPDTGENVALDDVIVRGPVGTPAETPPQLDAIPEQTATLHTPFSLDITAVPTDGDAVTLTADPLPAGATFTATGGSGTFAWADPTPVGVYTSVVYAVDNDGTNTQNLVLHVQDSTSTGNLVLYDFDGASGFDANPEFVAAGITAGAVATMDGAYTNYTGNPGLAISDTGWNSTTNALVFALTIPAGKTVNVSRLRFDDRRSGTGPTAWKLTYSGDGYVGAWATGVTHAAFASNDVAFALNGLTGAVTFRLYGLGASAASGTWRVDNLALDGAVITTVTDTDGDGLPDDYELAYTGSATGMTPEGDLDGDHAPNLSELIADTNPTNAASIFVIESFQGGPDFQIVFPSSSNRVYRLQGTPGWESPSWTNLVTGIPGSNSVTTLQIPALPEMRGYRLEVSPP